MVSKDSNNASRGRILAAAERLFAEKGFDACSVDEIAKTAEVNKALIYYYFKNKHALLDALALSFLEDLRAVKERHPIPKKAESLNEYNIETGGAIMGFLRERSALIRILLMQEIKGNDEPSLLIRMWRDEFEASVAALKKKGRPALPDQEFSIFYFFLQDLSFMIFYMFHEKWSGAMGIPEDETFRIFNRLMAWQRDAYGKARAASGVPVSS